MTKKDRRTRLIEVGIMITLATASIFYFFKTDNNHGWLDIVMLTGLFLLGQVFRVRDILRSERNGGPKRQPKSILSDAWNAGLTAFICTLFSVFSVYDINLILNILSAMLSALIAASPTLWLAYRRWQH